MLPAEYSYTRYLAAKESVDERSLNRGVWDTFLTQVRKADNQLKVLEVGGGVGATCRRIIKEIRNNDIAYSLLEIEPSNLEYIKTHLPVWMTGLGFELEMSRSMNYRFVRERQRVEVNLVNEDIHEFLDRSEVSGNYHVLVAQAFLDLFDLDLFLPNLLSVLAPGGSVYFPINFDGISALLPQIDSKIDDLIETHYHTSMDARVGAASALRRSHTGRNLLPLLQDSSLHITAAGSSDWVVFSDENNKYRGDEAYFLAHILHFFNNELSQFSGISAEEAATWIAGRYEQLKAGKLIYLAHQLDVAGILPI